MIFSRIFRPTRAKAGADDMTRVRSVARTHVGLIRKINEDRFLDRPARGLWAVADGMGGHHSGDVAAQNAIDSLDILERPSASGILRALEAANAAIYAKSATEGQRSGTTVVAALVTGGMIDIFWAGDSRAYRIRADTLELLTRDHSLVQQMVDAGALSAEAAARHPKSNVITRALGVESEVIIDRLALHLLPGDRFLLCSDGISRSLSDALPTSGSIEMLAQQLLDQALVLDGSDNASLILIDIS